MKSIGKCLLLLNFIHVLGYGMSTEYTRFSPKYEGTYKVQLKCQSQDTSSVCDGLRQYTYNMIVFNTLQAVRINFLTENNNFNQTTYWATGFETDGQELFANADSSSNDHIAQEIGMAFNDNSAGGVSVKGWIRDTNTRYDIQITGTQVLAPFDYFSSNQDPNNLISSSALVGDYKGALNSPNLQLNYRFSIRKSSQDAGGFLATLTQENGEKMPRDFVLSKFYPQFGALVFVGKGGIDGAGRSGLTKLVFSVTENPLGQVMLNGMMIYTNDPGYHSLRLKRQN